MAKKRRMPAHIVLPNGMWRFVKRGTKSVSKTTSRAVKIKHKRRTGVFHMAKRRVSNRKGMLGGAGVSGLAKSALIGIGGAHLSGYVPINVPYKEEAAGALSAYMLGGKNIKNAAAGAAAVYLAKMLSNNGSASSTSGQW